ncbi:hypothetical protein XELAEV_18021124mg [Xenopus laevis]|uniref:Uncharacterized protein n=1 Tax=Xenopus laevis TaxID=8355 RepID=A0A974D8D3_XENLA|nr:hypothetical protein XELAEV_18021124mg [Xenopus laevis]
MIKGSAPSQISRQKINGTLYRCSGRSLCQFICGSATFWGHARFTLLHLLCVLDFFLHSGDFSLTGEKPVKLVLFCCFIYLGIDFTVAWALTSHLTTPGSYIQRSNVMASNLYLVCSSLAIYLKSPC